MFPMVKVGPDPEGDAPTIRRELRGSHCHYVGVLQDSRNEVWRELLASLKQAGCWEWSQQLMPRVNGKYQLTKH